MDKIVLGKNFIANGFDVKVMLKSGWKDGHRDIKIDIDSEHLKTGMINHYSIPCYNQMTAEAQFYKEIERVKTYYSAPAVPKENVSPMNLGLCDYGF